MSNDDDSDNDSGVEGIIVSTSTVVKILLI